MNASCCYIIVIVNIFLMSQMTFQNSFVKVLLIYNKTGHI